MATREENIKKINDELEKLSDAELEQVSGGDMWDAQIAKNKEAEAKKSKLLKYPAIIIIDGNLH